MHVFVSHLPSSIGTDTGAGSINEGYSDEKTAVCVYMCVCVSIRFYYLPSYTVFGIRICRVVKLNNAIQKTKGLNIL